APERGGGPVRHRVLFPVGDPARRPGAAGGRLRHAQRLGLAQPVAGGGFHSPRAGDPDPRHAGGHRRPRQQFFLLPGDFRRGDRHGDLRRGAGPLDPRRRGADSVRGPGEHSVAPPVGPKPSPGRWSAASSAAQPATGRHPRRMTAAPIPPYTAPVGPKPSPGTWSAASSAAQPATGRHPRRMTASPIPPYTDPVGPKPPPGTWSAAS